MEELAKRKDLIINNLDKGVAVVIMGAENYNYIKEANRQLSGKANFKLKTQHYKIMELLTKQK